MKRSRWLGWMIAGAALFVLFVVLWHGFTPDERVAGGPGFHNIHREGRFYGGPVIHEVSGVVWLASLGIAFLFILKLVLVAAFVAAVVYVVSRFLKSRTSDFNHSVPFIPRRTYHTGAMLDEWEKNQHK
ncbi:hypothetical protein ACFSL6_27550 [Paenibacillus thailandensis]|uniref:Uncharacterized protein n=1 Tax=Paenibacillus thailandensis TaxID=393250 RepID=A0ABW5QXY1_9BACL